MALACFTPNAASAATWGSFDASRLAYPAAGLTGDVHSQLRDVITENGDEVGDATGEITEEYLAGVDVFYTSMVSDGTGPSPGALGTLSLDERAALALWIADGGTLIVTPDSNGFEGPWASVYDTYTEQYGVTDYEFVFGPGSGSPFVVHPITEGVTSYSVDSTARFEFGAEGELIGTAIDVADPFLVVYEPATGFSEGGRVLIIADHNALTNNYIGNLDNTLLASNIVGWAAGECGNSIIEGDEECDDGNTEDGDGCDSTCVTDSGGTGTGGASTGDGDSTGGADATGSDDTGDTTAGNDDAPTTGVDADGSGTAASGDSTGSGGEDSDDSGCGCRSQGNSPAGSAALLLLVAAGLRRRPRR